MAFISGKKGIIALHAMIPFPSMYPVAMFSISYRIFHSAPVKVGGGLWLNMASLLYNLAVDGAAIKEITKALK